MKKIPTLFVRDPDNRKYIIPGQVTPGCEWVLAGEGEPTRKWDGTCTMLDEDGRWWARREIKPGKAAPDGFIVAQHDEITGKTQGWEPMDASAFAKWHAEALENTDGDLPPGTYELIGPKINKDPDALGQHVLVAHGDHPYGSERDWPQDATPMEIIDVCRAKGWEGVVYHHPDGRMCKLKVRDIPPTV